MKIINKGFYVLFQLIRCVKLFSITPLLEINFDFNPEEGLSLLRKHFALDGYQTFIFKKFEKRMITNNYSIETRKLMKELFPNILDDINGKNNLNNLRLGMKNKIEISDKKYE